ncbi:MAG TPA: hypothetical protein VM736_00685 [Gemmatimonadales bacterium]|nr:hypothetical protein [Gemmatimonadales bacterium]
MRVRPHPQGAFEPCARAHLHTALQDHGPRAHVEDDARLDLRVAQRDRGGIAEHRAPDGNCIAVAQERAHVGRQQALERRHEVVDAAEHHAAHLDRRRVGLGTVPRRPRPDAPPDRDPAGGEPERAVREGGREPHGRERRRADHGGPRHGAERAHGRHAGLCEPGEVGEREDAGRLHPHEGLPPLANQGRAGPQLAQRPRPRERRPGRTGRGIEQVQGVRHSRSTSALSSLARPVGITSV